MRILIFLICLLPIQAGAFDLSWYSAGGGSPPAACDVSQEPIEDGAQDGYGHLGKYSSSLYRATKFVYTGTTDKQICELNVWMSYFSPSTEHLYYARIYSHNGSSPGAPDAILGTSFSLDLTVLGTSEEKITFTFDTPTSALTNGTTYWVCIYGSRVSYSHYAQWYFADGVTEYAKYSTDGSSWAGTEETTKTYKFELITQ